MAKLRGSISVTLSSIAETLELAVSSSTNYEELKGIYNFN